jgi:hypothetical protein
MSKISKEDTTFLVYFYVAIGLIMVALLTFVLIKERGQAEVQRAERDQLLTQEQEILPDETRARFVDPNSRSGERYFGIIVHDQTGCMYAVGSEGGTGRMSFPLLNPDGTCMRRDTQ